MTTQQMISALMDSQGCTELEAITGLQTAASMTGDDALLDELCDMKSALIYGE